MRKPCLEKIFGPTHRIKIKGQITNLTCVYSSAYFRLVCSEMFSLALQIGNFDLGKFLAHVRGTLKCGAPVRPNMFEHFLTRPCVWWRDGMLGKCTSALHIFLSATPATGAGAVYRLCVRITRTIWSLFHCMHVVWRFLLRISISDVVRFCGLIGQVVTLRHTLSIHYFR